MKTTTKTVTELIKSGESPLPLQVIPNNMGINLCSVESLTWTKTEDKQLVNLTINFIPAEKTCSCDSTSACSKCIDRKLRDDPKGQYSKNEAEFKKWYCTKCEKVVPTNEVWTPTPNGSFHYHRPCYDKGWSIQACKCMVFPGDFPFCPKCRGHHGLTHECFIREPVCEDAGCQQHEDVEAPGLCPVCLVNERDRLREALRKILGWREIDRNMLGERLSAIEDIARAVLDSDWLQTPKENPHSKNP